MTAFASGKTGWRNRLLIPTGVLALLLVTFGLRVMRLEVQSIWVDEGFSVDFASRTASDMTAMWKARGGSGAITDPKVLRAANDPLAIAVDIHPPLYYLMLHEWLPLAGRGEYAVRFPSVMTGVLLVVVLFKLGERLGGMGLGTAAGAVGAVSPFYVAYSQEARMYGPVALFSAISLYFAWQVMAGAMRRGPVRPWHWLGLVASSELALYTHYSSVLVVTTENLLAGAVLLWMLRSQKRAAGKRATGWKTALAGGEADATSSLLLNQPITTERWRNGFPWSFLGGWAISQAAELLLFLPWLRTSIGQVARYNKNLWTPNWQHEVTETFRAFAVGLWLPLSTSQRLLILVSAVMTLGLAFRLIPGARGQGAGVGDLSIDDALQHRAASSHFLDSTAQPKGVQESASINHLPAPDPRPLAPHVRLPAPGLPFGLAVLVVEMLLAVAIFQVRPEFHPRYLMVIATPYYLLLGLAVLALWRRLRLAGIAAGLIVLAVSAYGLAGYQFDPNFAKDDTRTLAQYLAGRTTADDVIFLDAPEPLGYYYHGPAKLYYIPGDEATAAETMTRLAAGKKNVVYVQWFLSTSDPQQLLPFLLQKYGRLVDDHTFRGYREREFALPPNVTFDLGQPRAIKPVDFAHTFQLEAATYGPSIDGNPGLLPDLAKPEALSGSDLMLGLRWKLLAPVSKDYKVTAYLTDDHGHLGGQVDLMLYRGQATTHRWKQGDEATNYYVMKTVAGLMPGSYKLNVGVYADGESERLSVLDAAGAPAGGSTVLGDVQILPPASGTDPAELGIPHRLDAEAAPGIRLAGYDLPKTQLLQGDELPLTLFWQVLGHPARDLSATLALDGTSPGTSSWRWSRKPRFPIAEWQPGQAFRDWYEPPLPPDLPPGTYRLSAGLGDRLIPIATLEIGARQRNFTAPTPTHPVTASIGPAIDLLGYDVDKQSYQPGDTVRLTLYWRDKTVMDQSYTVFAHILDGGRHVVSQRDAIPHQGEMPTNSWAPGEVVTDTYELPLKRDLPAGTYQLEVGFYRADTGVRLKAASSSVKVIDDGILIGTLGVR